MRVLLVTDFFEPYNGGVEVHVKTIAEALAERGHDVAVATLPTNAEQEPRTPGSDGHAAGGSGGRSVRVFEVDHLAARLGRGHADANRAWAPPFPDPLAMAGLRKVVRAFRPDVIHGHDWLARSVLPRVVSGSVPVVTSLHYYTRTCARKTLWRDGVCPGPGLIRCLRCAGEHYGPARGTVVSLGLRVGAAMDDRRTSRFISVSEFTAEGNGLTGHPKAAVVVNPLSPNALPSGETGSPALPVDIPDGPFLLYVGDLRPEKGIHTLLAAVTRLRRHYGNAIPLVLVGELHAEDLELPPVTVTTGLVDHRVVQALWRRATIGVVPSRWPEPFGLVAIEALAAGCPVVASDIAGLAEILGDDRGVLVPPGDHVALAAALHELSDDPERRRTLAENGRRSLERYEVDRIVDAIDAEYRAVTGVLEPSHG